MVDDDGLAGRPTPGAPGSGGFQGLKSDKAPTRVFAMGNLIRPWIKKRMDLQNLSNAEQQALLDKLLAYAAEGDKIFQQYKGKSVYME